MLDLEGLPGYETSSEEQSQEEQAEEEQPNQPFHYNESMKYIENFYNKYHSDADAAGDIEDNYEDDFHDWL